MAATEQRLIDAATRLFIRHGYQGTTLAAVAAEAGLAARTVYLRFGTKAALFRRVMGVAVAGDTDPVDVAHRDWFQQALTASSLDDRLQSMVRGTGGIMSRLGPLLPVSEQAAAVEPEIALAAQAAREVTRDHIRRFWAAAAADGLLTEATDLDWLAETVGILVAADTYLHGVRTHSWGLEEYEQWLLATCHRLVAAAAVDQSGAPRP